MTWRTCRFPWKVWLSGVAAVLVTLVSVSFVTTGAAGAQTTFSWVFNEQSTTNGVLTVNAAHYELHGPTAMGDLYFGQSVCAGGPGSAVPEVPLTILLPLFMIGLVSAYVLVSRRRRPPAGDD